MGNWDTGYDITQYLEQILQNEVKSVGEGNSQWLFKLPVKRPSPTTIFVYYCITMCWYIYLGRYAYSALADGADDEAEEPMMNEAFGK